MKTPTLHKLLHLATLTLALTAANAANVTWDANTALAGAQDGSGIWDTNSLNWWTGTANAAFVNGVPDVPTFGAGGVAGTVTLGTNITSGNIIFAGGGVGNYTIAGGGYQLALTNRTITANVSATISASIFGGTVSLANSAATAPSAVLTLSGNNTFTNFNLGANAGQTTAAVRVGANGALGVPSGQINVGGGQGSLTQRQFPGGTPFGAAVIVGRPSPGRRRLLPGSTQPMPLLDCRSGCLEGPVHATYGSWPC